MRTQSALEQLIILGVVIVLGIVLFIQSMSLYKQFKNLEEVVNSYYNLVFRTLIE